MTRRDCARHLLTFAASSPLLRGQDRALGLQDMINVFDFDAACRRTIARDAYDFVSGAADDEWTMQRNRDAFRKITFRPKMLVDVSKLDCSVTLFGQKIEMPILIAPTGTQGRVHAEGEPAMARAAGAAKTIMVVSTTSSYPIEKIAKAAAGPLWFQLYAGPDEDGTRERVERAVGEGCKAVCLTVDAPYFPHRERDLRNGLVRAEVQNELRNRRRRDDSPPDRYRLPSRFTAGLTWSFLDKLNSYAKVPVLVKGILTAADAKLAVEHGAAGVIVSNHGGRYLDGDPATIEVLPEIVEAAAGRVPVLVDGGFRRGTDILKALALGAKAVLVGRPPLWGLGSFGSAGAQRVLEMLQTEMALAMALSGRPNLAAIDKELVRVER